MSEEREERPLSYWMAVARMPFEEDYYRISGRSVSLPQNPTLEKMVALARSVGGIVQVRIIRDGSEVTRIVDYETAADLDDREEDGRDIKGWMALSARTRAAQDREES